MNCNEAKGKWQHMYRPFCHGIVRTIQYIIEKKTIERLMETPITTTKMRRKISTKDSTAQK
jgi:hypothetical protein